MIIATIILDYPHTFFWAGGGRGDKHYEFSWLYAKIREYSSVVTADTPNNKYESLTYCSDY